MAFCRSLLCLAELPEEAAAVADDAAGDRLREHFRGLGVALRKHRHEQEGEGSRRLRDERRVLVADRRARLRAKPLRELARTLQLTFRQGKELQLKSWAGTAKLVPFFLGMPQIFPSPIAFPRLVSTRSWSNVIGPARGSGASSVGAGRASISMCALRSAPTSSFAMARFPSSSLSRGKMPIRNVPPGCTGEPIEGSGSDSAVRSSTVLVIVRADRTPSRSVIILAWCA